MFCFHGHEACGILAARPGIESTPPALEGDVLTPGLLGESPEIFLFLFSHKIWALEGDLFLPSAHVLYFVSPQVFHTLLPGNVNPPNGQEILWFSLLYTVSKEELFLNALRPLREQELAIQTGT